MIFMFDVDSYGFKVKLFASLFVDVVNLDQISRNLYGNIEKLRLKNRLRLWKYSFDY